MGCDEGVILGDILRDMDGPFGEIGCNLRGVLV